MKESKVEEYLSARKMKTYTPHTTVDPNLFLIELAQIREKGYYLSYETFETGISCLAAPIFTKNGLITGVISFCAPTIRIMSKEQKLVDNLLETASKISSKLGYSHQNERNRVNSHNM